MTTPERDSRERIEAIARGEKTLLELADEFGITHQTMKEFSARHAGEIAARKAELQGELNAETAHLWVSDKAEIMAYYQLLLDRLKPLLTDPNLDDRSRSRFDRDAKALLRDCSELNGDLKHQVQMDMSGMELPPIGTKWVQIPGGVVDEVRTENP